MCNYRNRDNWTMIISREIDPDFCETITDLVSSDFIIQTHDEHEKYEGLGQ